jgi:hypothetical protein
MILRLTRRFTKFCRMLFCGEMNRSASQMMSGMAENSSSIEPENELESRTLEYGKLVASLGQESDRGLVLSCAALIDLYLGKIIRAFLVDDKDVDELFEGPYAPLSSLSAKTKMAYCLGLISNKERKEIDAVRKVRNVFAHEYAPDFEHPEVKKLCAKPPIYDGRNCDRDAYLHLGINLVLPLIYRDVYALKEKRRVWTVEETVPLSKPAGSSSGYR